MFTFLVDFVKEIFILYYQAAIYILFGFALAGLIRVFIRSKTIKTYLGTQRYKAVVRSSLFGIPLPLCSCSVLPTAISLRKSGASRGATTSFLISTPEVGVDGILITYGLMGGVMAVLRPVAAFVTAMTAGFFVEALDKTPDEDDAAGLDEIKCSKEPHGPDQDEPVFRGFRDMSVEQMKTLWRKSFGYAFGDLFDDISWWLALGFIVSGIITVAVPDRIFTEFLSGNAAIFVMLLVGIPIYVCAASSTPMAAAMLLKGMSPGAVIVFLLAGPATNLGSILVLKKFLGKKSLIIYLASIAVMTILFGYAVNLLFPGDTFPVKKLVDPMQAEGFSYIKLFASLLLLFLITRSFIRSPMPDEWVRYNDTLYRLFRFRFTKRSAVTVLVLAALVVYLSTMFLVVNPGELGFVRRFGKIQHENLPPGLHVHLPYPFDRGDVFSVSTVRKINVGFPGDDDNQGEMIQLSGERSLESLYITGDENIIDLKYVVQYDIRPELAFRSFYLVSELDRIIKSVAIKNMIKTIGTYHIDAVYSTERAAVELEVKGLIQDELNAMDLGIRILQVQLMYVHAPNKVHFYFRDVASAQEDMNRSINLAGVYATEKLNLARGTGGQIIKEADSFKTVTTNVSRGESESFKLQEESYSQAARLTRFRLYVETLETVLPGLRKYIKPPGGQMDHIDVFMLDPNILSGRTAVPEIKEQEEAQR
jgi:HflK protein